MQTPTFVLSLPTNCYNEPIKSHNMETRTVTLRLPQEIVDYVTRDDISMTCGIVKAIETLRRHERYADMELRGKFTPEEWMFLVDSFNGTLMVDDFRFVPSALVAHNEDSQLYERTADKWNVDLSELNRKCAALTASHVEAIYRRIERFWEHPNAVDLNEWARF